METTSLKDHFLIAMPGLADPNFFHTVTYICAHNEEGAMGIVINRPMDLSIGDILTQMDIETSHSELMGIRVFDGGPVHKERGFVLHQPLGEWEAMLQISEEMAITTSRDVLNALARGEGPAQSLVALGYAGWGAGQLEYEITENSWLSGPADSQIIFELPIDKRWEAAAALLGVDFDRLSGDVGHA